MNCVVPGHLAYCWQGTYDPFTISAQSPHTSLMAMIYTFAKEIESTANTTCLAQEPVAEKCEQTQIHQHRHRRHLPHPADRLPSPSWGQECYVICPRWVLILGEASQGCPQVWVGVTRGSQKSSSSRADANAGCTDYVGHVSWHPDRRSCPAGAG